MRAHGRRGSQVDLLLSISYTRSKKENSRSQHCCLQSRFERVDSHVCSPCLVGFVNHEFTGIDQHHHQHSAGEYVVGGDLALVVRVPHISPAAFVGRVGLGVGRAADCCCGPAERVVASGPRYGVPPYQAPLVKMLGSGSVAGPPAATSPKGATSRGLLWSWHHS